MVHVNDISVQPKRGRAGSENEHCVLAPTQEGTRRMRVGAISVEVRRSARRFSTHITVGRAEVALSWFHEQVRQASYLFDPTDIDPVKSLSSAFTTHPSVDERLKALGFKRH